MNLLSGTLGVIFTLQGHIETAFPLMLAAAGFDFCGGLLHQRGILLCIGTGIADEEELHVHPLADSLVVNLRHLGQLRVHFFVAHAGADGNRVQVLVDQRFFMTEQNGLAAQLVAAHGDVQCLVPENHSPCHGRWADSR